MVAIVNYGRNEHMHRHFKDQTFTRVQMSRTKKQCLTTKKDFNRRGHSKCSRPIVRVISKRARNVSEYKTTTFCSHNLMKKSRKVCYWILPVKLTFACGSDSHTLLNSSSKFREVSKKTMSLGERMVSFFNSVVHS